MSNTTPRGRDIEPIRFGDRLIGPNQPPFVVAEIAGNHQGDFGLAKKMVQIAAAMGVDCVKFQLHIVDDEMLPVLPPWDNLDEPLRDLLVRTHLTEAQHKELMKVCAEQGVKYLCTPFSRAAADILEDLGVEVFKTGSGELTNLPLQQHIARKGKPMVISTGMSTLDEVRETAEAVHKLGTPFLLTHCVSAYPAPYGKTNLGMIPKYEQLFGVPVGHSDHSLGIYTCLGAVAHGACYLEKHFTLDKWMRGPDHRASLEPQELCELTKGARAVWEARGEQRKIFEEERQVVAWARHSVVTTAPIRKGETITEKHVWVKRPGPGKEGIPAKELPNVLGRRAKADLPANVQVRREDIA